MILLGLITPLTASEVHGTGAGIMTLGTGTHGDHGATGAGTALGMAGTTLGITEAIGAVGTTHGITDITDMRDGTEASGALTMPDGTADGILIGTDIITDGIRDTIMVRSMSTHGEA